MNYIYDILLNYNDEDSNLDFFEWNYEDGIDHIKRIPIFRIPTSQLQDIQDNKIKIPKELLNKISKKTELYSNKKIEYACLFSDNNRVISLEFNKDGQSVYKSSVLLDEEEDIISESSDIEQERIEYEIISKHNKELLITRKEKNIRNYLLHELKNLYSENNKNAILYLYSEVYEKDKLSYKEKYNKLYNAIKLNYSKKYNKIYEILQLAYNKK